MDLVIKIRFLHDFEANIFFRHGSITQTSALIDRLFTKRLKEVFDRTVENVNHVKS